MDNNNRLIIKEILKIKLNIAHHREQLFYSIHRFYNYFIIISTIFLIINLLTLIGILKIDIEFLKDKEIFSILVSTINIIIFLFFKHKVKKDDISIDIIIRENSKEELQKTLKLVKEKESNIIDQLFKRRASTFAFLSTFIIIILIYYFVDIVKSEGNLLNSLFNPIYSEGGLSYGLLMLLVFLLGELLSNTKSPNKLKRDQELIVNKVKTAFILNIENSKILEGINDEKN